MPSKGVLSVCCGPGEMTCAGTGMVSMLPTVNPDLFKVEGGNVQVPQKLLERAHPDLHRANVTRILKLPDGTFQIEAMQHMTSHVSPCCLCLNIPAATGHSVVLLSLKCLAPEVPPCLALLLCYLEQYGPQQSAFLTSIPPVNLVNVT